MADIEARLAELLIERQDRPGSVFTLDHVESVIKIMGDPAEFGGEATENSPPPSGDSKMGTAFNPTLPISHSNTPTLLRV